MFGTSYFDFGVTSALIVDLALSSVKILTSAPCKMITCADVHEIFQNLCRSVSHQIRTVEKASRLSKSEHFYVDENFGDRI